MKILINAYACSPGMGSEPGMAWNWVSNLAKFCELYIITEGEFRDRIEEVVPTLEQGTCTSIIIRYRRKSGRCAGTRGTGASINIIRSGSGRRISWQRISVRWRRWMCCISST